MFMQKKHTELRENEIVKAWYGNLEQGAKITADVYLRTLGLYCKLNKTNPGQILEDAKTGKLRSDFMSFVHRQGDDEKAGSYTMRFKKVVSSWVRFNQSDAGLEDVKIRGAKLSPTIADEKVPQREDLNRMLRMATTRGRVIIGLLAFSGLRPESLGNYDASDAIRIRDIEGVKIGSDTVEFSVMPAKLTIRESNVQLSKKGHTYFTFIPQQSANYIKDYLSLRLRNGESLSPDSPIITVDERGRRIPDRKGILVTGVLIRDVRDAIKAADIKKSPDSDELARPYVLRAYFSSALDIAEAKGLVSHNWREFWHGHQGDISARYSTNKNLPDITVNEMRESFKKCLKYLETESKEATEDDTERILKEGMLNTYELYSKKKLSDKERDQFLQLSKDDLMDKLRDLFQQNKADSLNNGNHHKTISERELETYLNKGWELVQIYPRGDKAVVKLPD